MGALLALARKVDALNRRVAGAAAWLTLGMVLVGAFNAVARSADRSLGLELASNAWVELAWYLFSLVFLLGAPHALRADAHVRVDVLHGRLGARPRAWIDLAGSLLLLAPFCVFGIVTSFASLRQSWAVREMSPDPGGLPRWPLKAVVPAAFALLLAQGLSEAIKRLAILRGRTPDEVGLVETDPSRRGQDAPSEGTL